MQEVISKLNQFWEARDTLFSGFPLIEQPGLVVTICVAYVLIVKWLGPTMMKDREPYDLKNTMMVYNFSQVLISLYIFVKIFGYFLNGPVEGFWCQPYINNYGPEELGVRWALWIYFANKFYEFVDTFVFVARKKFNQVTFLHVYHHFTMPLYCYFRLNWWTIGQGMLFSAVNSFVHIVMYSYYFLAALGPSVRPWLWWKKYLTKLQLIQFAYGVFTEAGVMLGFLNCGFPRMPAMVTFACIHFPMGLMFANFYSKSYNKTPRKTDAEKITVKKGK